MAWGALVAETGNTGQGASWITSYTTLPSLMASWRSTPPRSRDTIMMRSLCSASQVLEIARGEPGSACGHTGVASAGHEIMAGAGGGSLRGEFGYAVALRHTAPLVVSSGGSVDHFF